MKIRKTGKRKNINHRRCHSGYTSRNIEQNDKPNRMKYLLPVKEAGYFDVDTSLWYQSGFLLPQTFYHNPPGWYPSCGPRLKSTGRNSL
jgi:hypothetical protein